MSDPVPPVANLSPNRPDAGIPSVRDGVRVIWKSLPLLVIGLGLGIGLGFFVNSATTPAYESRAKFVVGEILYVDPARPVDAETERRLVQTLILSIPSRDMHAAVAKRLNISYGQIAFIDLDIKKKLTGSVPEANIRIDVVRESRIGEITVTSQDPEFAAAVANTVLDELQLYNLIGGRMKNLQNSVALSKAKVDSLLQQLVEISSERIKVEQENAELDRHLGGSLPPADFPAFAKDATLNNLKTQLVLVESEYDQVATTASRGPRFSGKKAEVTSLRQQLNTQAGALAGALRSELQIARTREKDISSEVDKLTHQIDRMTENIAALLQALSEPQKLRQLAEEPSSNPVGPANVIMTIDRATPSFKPARPKLWLNLLLGAVFGGALGAAAATARILLDNRIKSPAQIAAHTGLPTLALLPKFKPLYRGSNRRSLFDHGQYPIGLGFLRSELIRHKDDPQRSIIGIAPVGIPRPFPNLAANLAVLLAQAELRTLVIDLNFAQPRQASLLGIRCPEGLAEWLACDRPLEEYINQSGNSHLGIIGPGVAGRDTDDLLSRRPLLPELEPLLAQWDYILIDAPALTRDWALSLVLPPRHSIILTADYGHTTFEDLEQAARTAANHNWENLGVVLQRCPRSICPTERGFHHTPQSDNPVQAPKLPEGNERRK